MSISRALGWATLVLAAMATGTVATRPLMKALLARTAVHAGAWRTIVATGSSEANFYERAAIAVAGIYALSRQETVYYTAFEDSEGRTLDGRCDYTVVGRPLPSRWWSFTMYGDDNYLVSNAPGVYSRHATNLEFGTDGGYAIAVSPQPQAHNWLPAPADGAFSITARLYNPDAAVVQQPEAVALPRIERGACR